MQMKPSDEIVIYQSKTGSLELKADVQHETIWLTQQQVAELFDVQKAAISKHVKNIFDSQELDYKATVSKMETVQQEGNRKVARKIKYYNWILFYQSATALTLSKQHIFANGQLKYSKSILHKGILSILIGYSKIMLNFWKLAHIKKLLPTGASIDHESILELITLFADTWLSLEAYDKDRLPVIGIPLKKTWN